MGDDASVDGEFGYDYFDNPYTLGYGGYEFDFNRDGYLPWEQATQFCSDRGCSSAIDVGCAKGFLVKALLDKGIDAIGIDISDYALQFAIGLPCYHQDVRDGLPGEVDAVFALGVLPYIPESDLSQVFGHFRAAARTYLLLSGYTQEQQGTRLYWKTKPRSWWIPFIEEQGFVYGGEVSGAFDIFEPLS